MSSSISGLRDDITGTAQQVMTYAREAALMRLPGADPGLLDVEFRYTVGEFLSRSLVWRRRVDVPITLNEGVYRLGLEAHEGVAVLLYGEVSRDLDGTDGLTVLRLGAVAHVQRPAVYYGIRRCGMVDHQRVSITPVPTENGYARFDVALTVLPHVEAPLPDVLLPWQEVLLAGLLSRMYAIPDKPYTNYNMADFHQRSFSARCSIIRREQEGGRAQGSYRPRIPTF